MGQEENISALNNMRMNLLKNRLDLFYKRYIEVSKIYKAYQSTLIIGFGVVLPDASELIDVYLKTAHDTSKVYDMYESRVRSLILDRGKDIEVPDGLKISFFWILKQYLNSRCIVGEDFAVKVDLFFEKNLDIDHVFSQINSENSNVTEDVVAATTTDDSSDSDSNSNYDSFRDFAMRLFEKVITRTNAHIAFSLFPDKETYTSNLLPVKALVDAGACYLLVDKDVYEENEKQPPPAWPFRPEYFKPYHSKTDNLIEGLAYIVHALRKLECLDQNQDSDKK